MMRVRSVKDDKWALGAGRYKLMIDAPTAAPKLFEFRADKHERTNLAKKKPEVVDKMLEQLGELQAIDRTSPF